MANTLANTSIYQSDLSGFKKPIVPVPKPTFRPDTSTDTKVPTVSGQYNAGNSGLQYYANGWQQKAMGLLNPQVGVTPNYSSDNNIAGMSARSSSKSTAPTLPNKSTLPTPPSTKRSSSVYTPPVPAIPGANPLDELYKRTPPPIKAELEAPKVATTTTPVIDLTKKQDDVYTPANYDFIDTMDIKGLKNLYRSFEYDKQQGKTLTKDQQLQMLYAQDRIGDLTKPQTMENPIDPIEEQRKQEKLQRQAELEAEQKLLITAQDNNEKQYIESQNILLQQAEDEQKKVMGYILGGQGAGTSSYGAEQLNKIGMNFTAQKQALLSESQERIQKYRAELSGASATELAKYDTNIQQLQLLSAQYDIDNVKAINEYNMQEGKDLASKFTALYDTSVLQAKAKAPLTAEETALAGYYSNFLVKDDGSLDPTTLALLEKTNPLLINSAVEQGIAIQKDRMSKGGDYSFANLGGGQIAVQDPKTGKVEFIQGNRQNEYDYQKDAEGNVYAINKTDSSDVKLVVQGSTNPMDTPSTDTTSFLKKWEGFREKAYQDSAGVWTVGYGFTTLNGKPVKQGDTIDRGTADSLLQDKIGQYQNRRNFVTTPLSSDQETALTSFEYNLGQGIRQTTGANIINSINNGDIPGAISILKQHINAGGKPIKGLVNRRNEEAKLLQNTQGGDQSQGPLTDPYIKTLFSNIQDLYKGTAQQATLNEQVEGLKDNPEQLKAFLLNQYASKKLSTEEKNRYDKSTSNAEQAQSLLDTLEYYNNQGFEYNNGAWSRAGRAIDRGTAWLGLGNIEEATQKFDELNSSLQEAGAERRNKIFGASLTTNEQGAAKPFIVQTTDLLPEIIAKLKAQKMVSEIAKERQIAEKLGMSYNSLAKIKEVQARFKQELGSDTTQSNTNPGILANPNKPTTTTNERVDQHLKDLGII